MERLYTPIGFGKLNIALPINGFIALKLPFPFQPMPEKPIGPMPIMLASGFERSANVAESVTVASPSVG